MNIKLIKSFLQSPIAVIKKDIREYMELKQNISQAQFDQACARARITLVCFNDEDRPSCITQHKFFMQSVHDIDGLFLDGRETYCSGFMKSDCPTHCAFYDRHAEYVAAKEHLKKLQTEKQRFWVKKLEKIK